MAGKTSNFLGLRNFIVSMCLKNKISKFNFMGVLIYLPFKTSASADQVLCFLLEPSETTYCLLSFLVNLNSSLRVVNYSVNLYFILKEINYMKCCLLDGFNGYWLMAVLNCLTKPSIVQCAKYLRAYFERSQLLLIGTSY